MRQRIIWIIILLFSIIWFSGCGRIIPYYAEGQKFKATRINQLVIGSSTRQDVLKLFGEPLERSNSDLYRATWWRYRYGYLGTLGVEMAELEIDFKGNLVENYQIDVAKNRY